MTKINKLKMITSSNNKAMYPTILKYHQNQKYN